MTFAVTVDRKNGKMYFRREPTVGWRVCVFYMAIDLLYESLDVHFNRLLKKIDKLSAEAK